MFASVASEGSVGSVGFGGTDTASSMAGNWSRMNLWRSLAIMRMRMPLPLKEETNDTIRNLLDFQLPESLFEVDVQSYSGMPAIKAFIERVQAAKASVSTSNSDPKGITLLLPVLARAFDDFAQPNYKSDNESTQSHPMFHLLCLAFRHGDRKNDPSVKCELEICLPASEPGFPTKSRLDFGIVYMNSQLVSPLPGSDGFQTVLQDAFWQANPHTQHEDYGSLLIFPGESKKVEGPNNRNQLIYDLSTCLHHQESLGLGNFENYGFTLAAGIVQIYGMKKTKEGSEYVHTLLTYEHAVFNLRDPLEFLKCYWFLRGLADHLTTTLVEPFLALTSEKVANFLLERSGRPSWRSWRATVISGLGGGLGACGGGTSGRSGGSGGSGSNGDDDDAGGGSGDVGRGCRHGNKRLTDPPADIPVPKRQKQGVGPGEGTDAVEEPWPVPELDDILPYDARPHELSRPSTFSVQTRDPNWDVYVEPRENAGIPLSAWIGDGKAPLPLSIENLKTHTEREGSVDVISHSGISSSSRT